MRRKWLSCVVLAVFVAGSLNVSITRSEVIRDHNFWHGGGTWIYFPDEDKSVWIGHGQTYVVDKPCRISFMVEPGCGEWSYVRKNVDPKTRITITLKKGDPMRKEASLSLALLIRPEQIQRRKVMLNYPPASSVWHLPNGIAQLAALLRKEGHEVLQRYGHILGLEHVLKKHGGAEIDAALAVMRDRQADISMLYAARMTFERVSRGIAEEANDKFAVTGNNVNYVSSYGDGTIEKALEAIKNREQHLWYDYFKEVELPLVRDFKPDIYGISVADERQFIQGIILASMVKDECPGCLVVLGGNFWPRVTHAFSMPNFAQFFNHCDAIVYREGYQPLQQLAATLDPASACGVAWRSGAQVVINPATQNPTDFQTLPTPEFDGGARQWSPDFVPSLYTMSNCPMACGFCAIGGGSDTFLGNPRSMSPQRIAEHVVALGAKRFDVFDELFSVPRQIALGKEFKRLGWSATWQCYLTVTNNLLDPSTCEKLYEAGCRGVQLGLETLSPNTLLREHKQWNTPDNYGKILANLKAAGIQTHVFLIVGIPGEPLHWSLKWSSFFEQYGDSVLTIKSGRYRLSRHSPEQQGGTHNSLIEVPLDTKPLKLNRDFSYRNHRPSNSKVDAMRTILEQVCRKHWAYGVTSTIGWWVNRGRYSWDELRTMAQLLAKDHPEPDTHHLEKVFGPASTIIKEELGQRVSLANFDALAAFARTLQ